MRNEAPPKYCQWQTPQQLLDRTEADIRDIGNHAFLTQNKTKHLREAWIIGEVGKRLSTPSIRLAQDDPPDGYILLPSRSKVPIEITELLQKGRRRGDEDCNYPKPIPGCEIKKATEDNLKWLEERIQAKLSKDDQYPCGTVLVVYHNTSLFNFDPGLTQNELEEASRLSGTNIIGSLIYYGDQIYGKDLLKILNTPITH